MASLRRHLLRPRPPASGRLRMAVAIAIGAVLLSGCGGGGSKHGATATALSRPALVKLAKSVGHPVYWAGPENGVSYEVTRLKNGRIFVRYLPSGEKIRP